MKKLWWIIKCLLGFGSVNDGSICWFSKKFFDVHDYHLGQGGDGTPTHFYDNTCERCGTKFKI